MEITPEFAEYLNGLKYLIEKGYDLNICSQKRDKKDYLIKSKEDLEIL